MNLKFLDGFKGFGKVLKNTQYRKQWIAITISNAGTQIHRIALLVLVYDLTGKAINLGILMICGAAPAFLMAPIAGIVVDRVDRKKVLIIVDFIRAGLVFAIPFATELWHIYVIAGALGACGTFYGPAMFSSIPRLVSKDELVTANSLQMTTINVVAIIAPAVAGLLVARVGTTYAFWFDSLTYIASAIMIWTITTSLKPERDKTRKVGVIQEYREGIKAMFSDKVLVYIIGLFTALILFTSGLNPLFIVLTKEVLKQGTEQYGFLISALGVGGILGGLIFGAIGNRFGRIAMVVNLLFIDGVLVAMMGILPLLLPPPYSYYGALVVFFCFGAMGTIFHINIITLLQERVPDELRGKFFAVFGVIFEPIAMLSMGGFGYIADLVKVQFVFIGSAAFELCVTGIARFLPVYHKVKDPKNIDVILTPETVPGVIKRDAPDK